MAQKSNLMQVQEQQSLSPKILRLVMDPQKFDARVKIVQREAKNEMGRSNEEGHIIKDVIRKMELVLNDGNGFMYGSNLDHDTLNNQDNMLAEYSTKRKKISCKNATYLRNVKKPVA